jgi:small subunit ribosomal protein S8
MRTDPIAELLTRIRNAIHARFNDLVIAHSRMREAICRVLVDEGFLDSIEIGGEAPRRRLVIKLRYAKGRDPVIRGISRVSRPSVRRYAGVGEIGRSRGAMGIEIVSTPLGVMSGREARRKHVGGEVLCRVW